MTVMDISMPARIRIFRAVYVRDLDRVAASEVIRLGLMGDLRFGDRYALGVIARRTVDESELASVGRLASALVAEPFGTLRGYFKRTWETSAPQEEFNRIIAATGSSLWFQQISDHQEVFDEAEKLSSHSSVDEVRTWCKAELRKALRSQYDRWINDRVSGSPDGAEEVDAQHVPLAA
jgi:hypothetical protein